MNILIADDETMIRLSLQSMLEELYPGEHTYFHAPNGEAVLTQLQKITPDLAFLDIRMPLMNGLEVLENSRSLAPATTWVILSGYAEFTYAQKAMSLSAHAYLLKPVDLKTLQTVMEEVQRLKAKQAARKNQFFHLHVMQAFHMADQLGPEEGFFPRKQDHYILYQIYMDRQKTDPLQNGKKTLYQKIRQFCHANEFIRLYSVFFNTDGVLCIICSGNDFSHLSHVITVSAAALPETLFSVFFETADSVYQLYLLSRRIHEISPIRMGLDCKMPTALSSLESMPALESALSFCRQTEQFISYYLSGNFELLHSLLSVYETKVELQIGYGLMEQKQLTVFFEETFNRSFSVSDYESFQASLLEIASLPIDHVPGRSIDLHKIKEFVYQNYSKDVSISCASEYFNLSPTYFSRIFHEKSGQKYIDFVTQVRMESAKKRMDSHPSSCVKQIAELTGYTSVRHFSKIFQKYTGYLPTEYMEKQKTHQIH